ncbi:MAG: hypothetical protein NZM26_04615 [Patescibacteria group bacterium]|nr:hypothetical protein [Patescibacteria group bacterium]
MDQEHAIPQQISSYQFRLVGDMTIKQFFQVAGGVLVALLLYSSNLPSYIKWPFMIVSFLFGLALAFFPVEDRPLSRWIILFFKSIYSPTLYEWQKDYQKPYYFQDDLPSVISQTQTQNLQQVSQDNESVLPQTSITNQPNKQEEHVNPFQVPLENKEKIFLNQVNQHLTDTNSSVDHVDQNNSDDIRGKPVSVPQIQSIHISTQPKDNLDFHTNQVVKIDRFTTVSKIAPISGNAVENTQSANFSQEAALPLVPTQPNIVVGQISTKDGKIIENAIIEIRDEKGFPVRALKSNQLGHFAITTPLPNGKYHLIVEKDGYNFSPIFINLTGNVVLPIAVNPEN